MTGLILAAAGSGQRFGSGIPKQFRVLEDQPVYLHALQSLQAIADEIVIAVPAEWQQRVMAQVQELECADKICVVAGGSERQDSVRLGLEALPDSVTRVIVHDAVRPFCSAELARRVLAGLEKAVACVPILPIAETVKEIEGSLVLRTWDRKRLRLSQTPQAFERRTLERALHQAILFGTQATDEAALVESLGEDVFVVEGERRNVKITWQDDLPAGGMRQ